MEVAQSISDRRVVSPPKDELNNLNPPLEPSVKSVFELLDQTLNPRRSDYVKRPVLSATIHPDLKRTLVAMSKRTGMSVSQVTDEVLYTGLIDMQEIDEL